MASIQATGAIQPVQDINKTENKGAVAQVKDFAKDLKKAAFGEKGSEIAKEAFKGAAIGAAIGTFVLPGGGTLLGAAAGAAYMGGKEAAGATIESESSKKAIGLGAGAVLGAAALGPLGIPLGMVAGAKIVSGEAKEAMEKMTSFIKDKFSSLTGGE